MKDQNKPEEQEAVIVYEGTPIKVASLPKEIQNYINCFSTWERELQAARIEVFKLEAAIRGITAEVNARIGLHLNPPKPPAKDEEKVKDPIKPKFRYDRVLKENGKAAT